MCTTITTTATTNNKKCVPKKLSHIYKMQSKRTERSDNKNSHISKSQPR